MSIPESVVTAVVTDVSKRMEDPSYAQLAIGSFAQAHPDAGRFITAHLDDLGSGEAVMHAVFHAEVLNECFTRHLGRSLAPVGFVDLDHASQNDPVTRFGQVEPALSSYVVSNVETPEMQKLLALVGCAMSDIA